MSWISFREMWESWDRNWRKDGFDWTDPHHGHGTGQRSWHNEYKQKKNSKAKAKNRAGKKARKANRRKK